MTKIFAAPPVVGTSVITTNRGVSKHVAVPAIVLPNRSSVSGGYFQYGGFDNVGSNSYGQMSTVGDWVEWDVVLPQSDPGKFWALSATFWQATNAGIATIKVDGLLTITADTYKSSTDMGTSWFAYVGGGGVGTYATTRPKKVTIRMEVTGKNASAGAYYIVAEGFAFYQV